MKKGHLAWRWPLQMLFASAGGRLITLLLDGRHMRSTRYSGMEKRRCQRRMSYKERRWVLDLPTLDETRIKGEMITISPFLGTTQTRSLKSEGTLKLGNFFWLRNQARNFKCFFALHTQGQATHVGKTYSKRLPPSKHRVRDPWGNDVMLNVLSYSTQGQVRMT